MELDAFKAKLDSLHEKADMAGSLPITYKGSEDREKPIYIDGQGFFCFWGKLRGQYIQSTFSLKDIESITYEIQTDFLGEQKNSSIFIHLPGDIRIALGFSPESCSIHPAIYTSKQEQAVAFRERFPTRWFWVMHVTEDSVTIY